MAKHGTVEVEVELTIKVTVRVQAKRRYATIKGIGQVATGFTPVVGTTSIAQIANLDTALLQHLNGDGGELDAFDYACFKVAGIDPKSVGE